MFHASGDCVARRPLVISDFVAYLDDLKKITGILEPVCFNIRRCHYIVA